MADESIVDTGDAGSPHQYKDPQIVKPVAESCSVAAMVTHDVKASESQKISGSRGHEYSDTLTLRKK